MKLYSFFSILHERKNYSRYSSLCLHIFPLNNSKNPDANEKRYCSTEVPGKCIYCTCTSRNFPSRLCKNNLSQVSVTI